MKKIYKLLFASLIVITLVVYFGRLLNTYAADTALPVSVTLGTDDLCASSTVSDTTLNQGGSLTITTTANTSDIVSFGWWFYNLDNLDASNNPKAIKFATAASAAGVDYSVTKDLTISQKTYILTVNFDDINKKDLNWNYYLSKPKRIRVDAYFKKAGSTTWSKFNANCVAKFNAATVDPTPTPNPSCVCSAANTCATACFYDKYATGVTYASPMKCDLGAGIFSSAPTATNKNNWCRAYLRTRGDANGDGYVNMLDYFYYVTAINGGKLPPSVNIDFNGDGVVSSADKDILVKYIKGL